MFGVEKLDAVLAQWILPTGIACLSLAKRCRVVTIARGVDLHVLARRSIFSMAALTKIIQGTDVIACNGRWGMSALRDLGVDPKDKFTVIRNPKDLSIWLNVKKAAHCSSEFRLVCVCRLEPMRKRVDVLIDAIEIASHDTGPIHLTVVGDGPARTALQKRASALPEGATVTFAGTLPHDRIAEVFSNSDLFVLPSQREGCPNVVVEAMAAGLPVVVSDSGETKYLVDEGATGFVIPTIDAYGFGEAIVSCARRRDELPLWGEKGREKVRALFDRDKNVQFLIDALYGKGS